ncbi:hypothetical protein LTR96_002327 [Exophiala xenobiotica]|nr:hypothetical protein H2202_007272 [Exophiala xenobiotica]KAK5195566.1 hypothetical protein LTR92_004506 [Exophiala xenobiotica]KAK5226130.1 hypothetical protein LTR72_004034 [Exophiala xenobiotica]KAK5272696.1 hypothetical protein LTR96_002327 [Exophiala xenobiotica]KAK5292242.1 hypothetical protein LTR14_005792 [Exophiala xenobiotica]
MASEKKASITIPSSLQTGRRISPSPQGLRQRPLGRASTFAEENARLNRRSSSFLSESLSETRKSLLSSTDGILLPRLREEDENVDHDENSHWQSLPLGLALLPAVGGLFFKEGSSVITDVTLLGLAAIFMNWALRSPWDWYRAAQSQILPDSTTPPVFTPVDEADEEEDTKPKSGSGEAIADGGNPDSRNAGSSALYAERTSAQRELRFYELVALLCCFSFPLLAAWLLHGIRSQLTRPSEGLVSNYNLTIFILVAEIRPLSHMIKMVQRRTLFLQRKVNVDLLAEDKRIDSQQLMDVSRRLEEMESHVADQIAARPPQETDPAGHALDTKLPGVVRSEVQKTVQPEVDALNRAMRRYEKRTTISAVQFEARLQDLEARLNDVVSLAAAAQRNADRKPDKYIVVLTNWMCAIVVIPAQYLLSLLSLPGKVVSAVFAVPKRYLWETSRTQSAKDGRPPRRNAPVRAGERERRPKGATQVVSQGH